MYTVGVTGGIGSGKSTVTAIFHSFGIPIIDTDVIATTLSQPNMPGAEAVSLLFGTHFLDRDGAIERAKLRRLIFNDLAAKQKLEAVLHPLIQTEAHRQLTTATTDSYVMLAVPLLFETGSYLDIVSVTLLVDCPESLQISRVMARSQLSSKEVEGIMRLQMSRSDRQKNAADIIINDGSLTELIEKAKILHRKYTQDAELQQDSK